MNLKNENCNYTAYFVIPSKARNIKVHRCPSAYKNSPDGRGDNNN